MARRTAAIDVLPRLTRTRAYSDKHTMPPARAIKPRGPISVHGAVPAPRGAGRCAASHWSPRKPPSGFGNCRSCCGRTDSPPSRCGRLHYVVNQESRRRSRCFQAHGHCPTPARSGFLAQCFRPRRRHDYGCRPLPFDCPRSHCRRLRSSRRSGCPTHSR
jgi:hypothetical protein